MTQPTKASASKIHGPTFWILFILLGIGALITRTEAGLETFQTILKGIFSLITTPFILEGLSMVLMAFIVAAVNRWRRHRQPSDWVVMPFTEEAETEPADDALLKNALAQLRDTLDRQDYPAAYQQVKSLPSFPSDGEAVLMMAEALAKNFKVDEAMDLLQVHRRQFTSAADQASRKAFSQNISLWLSQQKGHLALDTLPRWNQLQSLHSTPATA